MSAPLTLAIFVGLPGSGKTSLARPLAAARGWTFISRDEIRAEQFADSPPEVWKPAANEETERRTRAALTRGESVVVDGVTFARAALRERFAQAARDQGARFLVVWVDCPVDEAIRRVARSNVGHPAAAERTAERVREVMGRFEPPAAPVLRLDALRPANDLLRELMAAVPARA